MTSQVATAGEAPVDADGDESESSEADTCPTCGQVCKNEQGMRIHHYQVHGESLARDTAECQTCGDVFEIPPGSNGKYCSRKCFYEGQENQVELECEQCGDVFEFNESQAEDRKFCSMDCYAKSRQRREKRECKGCGRTFEARSSSGNECCSRVCMGEVRTSKPRPEDFVALVWLLYVYEDHNFHDTWLRVNANRDERVYKKDLRDFLREAGWMAPGGRARFEDLTLEDVGLADPAPDGDDTWKKYRSEGGEEA